METLVKPERHLSAGRGRNVELWPRAQKVVNPGLALGSHEIRPIHSKPRTEYSYYVSVSLLYPSVLYPFICINNIFLVRNGSTVIYHGRYAIHNMYFFGEVINFQFLFQ